MLYDQISDMEILHFGYWDDPDDDSSFDVASPRLTDQVTGQLDVRAGQRSLDVGCGIGTPAIQVARTTGTTITGITASREQVRWATAAAERCRGHGRCPHVPARRRDVPKLPGKLV